MRRHHGLKTRVRESSAPGGLEELMKLKNGLAGVVALLMSPLCVAASPELHRKASARPGHMTFASREGRLGRRFLAFACRATSPWSRPAEEPLVTCLHTPQGSARSTTPAKLREASSLPSPPRFEGPPVANLSAVARNYLVLKRHTH